MVDKKGDLQINESIIVIIVFSVILIIAIGIFYRYNIQSVNELENEFQESNVINLLNNLPNSPEMSYSMLGDDDNSIDTSKLLKLKLSKLGFMEIKIKEIYPLRNKEICSNSNYPNCDEFIVYSFKGSNKNSQIFSAPVSLYYPSLKEYRAGILEIKWYN